MHIEKINGLFFEIDQARTGTITFEMFKKKMDSPEVRTFFETIELDVWDAWAFFKLLDLDGGRWGMMGISENFCFQDLSGTQEVSRSIIDPEKWNSRKKRVETNHSTLHHFVENRNASLDDPPQKNVIPKKTSSNHRRLRRRLGAKVVQLKLRNS